MERGCLAAGLAPRVLPDCHSAFRTPHSEFQTQTPIPDSGQLQSPDKSPDNGEMFHQIYLMAAVTSVVSLAVFGSMLWQISPRDGGRTKC
jgi:hypothetical protein